MGSLACAAGRRVPAAPFFLAGVRAILGGSRRRSHLVAEGAADGPPRKSPPHLPRTRRLVRPPAPAADARPLPGAGRRRGPLGRPQRRGGTPPAAAPQGEPAPHAEALRLLRAST